MKNDKPAPLSQAEIKKAVSPERYAEILAHLLHFRDADPAEVVRRLGVAPEVWAQADAFWAGELELGIRRQQRELSLRFSAALARTRVRLAKKNPPLSAIGTLDTAPPEPEAPKKDTASPAAASQGLPSFMAAPQVAATPMVAPPAPTPMVTPPSPIPGLSGPQTPGLTASPPPAARPRTMAIPAYAPPEERKVFAEGIAPDVALKSAIEHAEATQGPRPAAKPMVGLTEPAQADEIAAIAQRLMPFGPGGAPKKTAPQAPPPPEPAAPAAPANNPSAMPVERHASLHVELSMHPEQRAEILQRYGLSAEQHARLDAAWQARLSQDTALRSAWDAACTQYRAWLLRAKPAG